MKKNVIMIAAILALASCSREAIDPSIAQESNAIRFNAYTESSITKGVAIETGYIQTRGIGVFAFYQGAIAGEKVNFNTRKFAIPDFMYNQQVAYSGGSWTYSPTKYWPNNAGDQLSFFAYAPYDENITWDELGIATDATASKITASFPIYNEKAAMQDILWTDPQINKTKASTTSGTTNNPITFNFRHLLTKVALSVGVETDKAAGTPSTWTYPGTTITIDKVEFTNLADEYKYSCPINASGAMSTGSWSAGSMIQNIVLTRENGDFAPDSSVISNAQPWNNSAAYHTLLSKEDSKPAFLFLAPQTFTSGKEQVIITYTVKTVDANDKANGSTITNVIATDLSTLLPTTGFESGSAYNLNFLLGMNSVKFSVNVTDWDELPADTVDVPSNAYIVANTLAIAQDAVAGGADGTIEKVTVEVTPEAVQNATEDDVIEVNGKKYLQFILKITSPKVVGFELPEITNTDYERLGADTWLVTYEPTYPTTDVTVDAPENTKVKIEAPTSHVEVTGTTYAQIIASTDDNTLVIPDGISVDSLIVNKGGLEIHGTVAAASVDTTGGKGPVYVRACENLKESVYLNLEPYIDVDNGYVGEKVADNNYRIYQKAESEKVAKIGDVTYYTLASAVKAATAGQTITLVNNVPEPYSDIFLRFKDNVTLDLNGNTITSGVIDVDSTYDYKIGYAYVFEGNGITIKNGTILGVADGLEGYCYGLYIGNEEIGNIATSNVTVEDVVFPKGGINIYNSTNVTVKNCDITVYPTSYYAVYVCGDGASASVAINGGTYRAGANGYVVCTQETNYEGSHAAMTISAGTFTGGYSVETGSLSITGGTYSVNPANYVANGYMAVKNEGTPETWSVKPYVGLGSMNKGEQQEW